MSGSLTGGLRDRMLIESLFQHMKGHLDSLGWFDSGRQHSPIAMVDEYPDVDTEVPINTLAMSIGDTHQSQVELGSLAETHGVPVYIDFFAESEGLGRHLIGDLYAWLNANPVLPVYDYDLATPTVDFHVQVVEESVEKSRPPRATNDWLKHWHMLGFLVEDVRANV